MKGIFAVLILLAAMRTNAQDTTSPSGIRPPRTMQVYFANSDDEDVRSNEISVYPNPVAHFLTIRRRDMPDTIQIVVTNRTGRVFIKEIMGKKNLSLDISFLQKGAYLLQLRGRDYIQTVKIDKL